MSERGFLLTIIGDGRPLLAATGLGLVLAGSFGLFLAISGEFLPHDERFLGMTANELRAMHGCRVVHFMIHDRASYGGALLASGDDEYLIAFVADLLHCPTERRYSEADSQV
jgi:hypothetical protein